MPELTLVQQRDAFNERYAKLSTQARASLSEHPVGNVPATVFEAAQKMTTEAVEYRRQAKLLDDEITTTETTERAVNSIREGGEPAQRKWSEFSAWLRNPNVRNLPSYKMGMEEPKEINVASQLRSVGYNGKTNRADYLGTVDLPTGGEFVRPADYLQTLIQDLARKTIMGGALKIPVSGQALDMYQLALNMSPARITEGDAITPSTFSDVTGKTTLVVKDYAVAAYIHENSLTDYLFPAEAIVLNRFARGFAYKMDELGLYGAGGDEPLGILNTPDITAIDQIDKDFISAEDIVKLPMALEAQYRELGGAYIMHRNTLIQVLLLRDDSGGAGTGRFLLQPDFQTGMPSRLNGYPYIETEFMTDPIDKAASGLAATDCRVLFGSIPNYAWAVKGGLEVATSPHVQFLSRMMTYRGVMRFDGAVVLKAAWARLNKGALN